MGNRGVIRQLLSSRRRQTTAAVAGPAADQRRALTETLEARRMLSTVINTVWNGRGVEWVKNEYVVEFRSGVNVAKVAKESNFTGLRRLGTSQFYQLTSGKWIKQMEAWASAHKSAVVGVTPNLIAHPTDVSLPNDPFINSQWHHNNTGQVVTDPQWDPTGSISFSTLGHVGGEAGKPDADIDTAEAWTIVRGDPNAGDPTKQIVVAVLDTGIDWTHPDLASQVFTNPFEIPDNGVDDDNNGFVDDVRGWDFANGDNNPLDDVGHGTHVSGIIGATGDNGIGVSGVIQNVKILPVKVLGVNGGTTADIITGYEYVTMLKNQGINIVAANASLGGLGFPFNRVENDAISRMGQAGILFVVAAGNDTLNTDIGQDFPAKFSLNQPNVITVAATDNKDQIAFFSNIGAQSVAIAAPGMNILSTFPTYDVGTLLETGQLAGLGDKSYGYDSGTSMAAPMVAGAIALMKAARPDASAAELKKALLAGADKIPALTKPLPAGDPLVTTAGRLNVYRAILNLLEQKTNTDTATRGSWRGSYGQQGKVIFGETVAGNTFSNSFVNVQFTNAALNVVDGTSNDPDALQSTFNSNTRIASQLTSAGPITVDLDFTDDKPHRVSLYQADLAGPPGYQSIELVEPDTGTVISTYYTGNLKSGEYTTIQLTPGGTPVNRVRLVIRGSGGRNAILNGMFFDAGTAAQNTLVVNDPVAGVTVPNNGDWRRLVGSQGAKVFGTNVSTLGPKVKVSGGTVVSGASGSAALIAPKATDDSQRVSGYLRTKSQMNVRVNLTGLSGQRKLTVYAADFGNVGRAERVELYNASTGTLVSTVDFTKFAQGKYASWIVSGGQQYKIRVVRLAGPDAVLGGVFLDAAPGAAVDYQGMDVASQGDWKTYYGADAAIVFGSADAPVRKNAYSQELKYGDQNVNPGYRTQTVSVKFNNGGAGVGHVVHEDEDRFPLVQSDVSQDRVNNPKVTGSTMNVDLKFTDQRDHTVALYMVDPDKDNTRAQKVDVQTFDAARHRWVTVATQFVTNFSGGKYVVFNARKTQPGAAVDVRVKITRLTGQTAVVNGVFLN